MTIIDSQVHVWEAESPGRAWPDESAKFRHGPPAVTAEWVLQEMELNGVAGAILVPPSFEGDRNDTVRSAAQRYPNRFVAMGRVALDAEDAQDRVRSLASDPFFVGLRVTFNARASKWLKDGTIDWLWPLAEEIDLAVSVFPPGQTKEIAKIASAHPDLRLSIDHLALGLDIRDEMILPEIAQLCDLARFDNVAVKASCLPSYVTEAYPYPYPVLGAVLQRVVDAFGARRVFWGSDLTRLGCKYSEAISYVSSVTPQLGYDDVRLIMGDAIRDWFRIASFAKEPPHPTAGV